MFLNETITLVATPKRNDGTPGAISDTPVWSSDSANVVLTPAADGLTCAVFGSEVGTALIVCNATNSVGVAIAGTYPLEVVLGPADFLEISQQ